MSLTSPEPESGSLTSVIHIYWARRWPLLSPFVQLTAQQREQSSYPERVASVNKFVSSSSEAALEIHLLLDSPFLWILRKCRTFIVKVPTHPPQSTKTRNSTMESKSKKLHISNVRAAYVDSAYSCSPGFPSLLQRNMCTLRALPLPVPRPILPRTFGIVQ